jgi:hypothetical protein
MAITTGDHELIQAVSAVKISILRYKTVKAIPLWTTLKTAMTLR